MNTARRVFETYSTNAQDKLDTVAMTFHRGNNTTSYTYAELLQQATLTGNALQVAWSQSNGNSNDILAILATSQEQQVLQVLGALHAGIIPAVLTPPNRKLERNYYAKTTAAVLDKVRPALVVSDITEEIAELPERSFGIANLDGTLLSKPTNPQRLTTPDETAFVQFSSGTTGIKKGVAIDSHSLISQLATYARALQPTQEECIVSWLPLYHDMGYITALHLALHQGIHSVMLDPIEWVGNPTSYLDAITEHRGTMSWHPNFAYAFMATRAKPTDATDLSSLRHLVNCSEPTTSKSQNLFTKAFEKHGLKSGVMTGCYAMAETTFAVTHFTGTDIYGEDDIGPEPIGSLTSRLPIPTVGTPLNGVSIEVRDSSGNIVDDRTIGELWIKAPFLAMGYLSDAADANDSFSDGWYCTGDLGYSIDNRYFVTGRRKDLIIVAGHNVFPEDIENAISSTGGIKAGRVAVFAEFDDRSQTEHVIALAEPDDTDEAPNLLALRQQLLAEFSVATAIHLVDTGWLIKSSSGKISRSASAAKWASHKSS